MQDPRIAAALAAAMHRAGVADVETTESVDDAIEMVLSERSHSGVRVVGLQYGVLRLEADQVGARMLGLDRDPLLAAIELRVPGAVAELRICVARGR